MIPIVKVNFPNNTPAHEDRIAELYTVVVESDVGDRRLTGIIASNERTSVAFGIGSSEVYRIARGYRLAMLDCNGLFQVDQSGAGREIRLAEEFVNRHRVGRGVGHIVPSCTSALPHRLAESSAHMGDGGRKGFWRDLLSANANRIASIKMCRYCAPLCSSCRMSIPRSVSSASIMPRATSAVRP